MIPAEITELQNITQHKSIRGGLKPVLKDLLKRTLLKLFSSIQIYELLL